MSVIGLDIGNENCVIAAAKRGGIDVLLNDEAKRESPGVVSFGDKQRFLGSTGAAFATANPKSTISQIKRLIGRQYKEQSVQEELKLLPFMTSEGPRGGILIELEYMKEKWTFTPVEILGMLFRHLKQIAEKNLESAIVDCVIGIPSYFTDLQRREYLDAASIAGLKPLMLMHEGTAIALGYGMYKTDLSVRGPTNVIFVDIGQSDTQVTVAAFKQGQMKILAHSFDQSLGGRDFDNVLLKYFSTKFKEEYNIDVHSNPRARVRLMASCEKLKKVLSANTEAPLSIECLIEDKDVKGSITRDEFEKLSLELLERITVPCIKAVEDSGIDTIYTVELVGSGSRIPAITRYLASLFKKEPTRTLNASECVARGCALACAMLSPSHKVQDYQVRDLFPYSIGVRLDEGNNIKYKNITAIRKGSAFPIVCMLTHHANTIFYFHVFYTNEMDVPAGISPKVGYFMMGPSQTSSEEKVKIVANLRLNKHGIVEIEFGSALEDESSLLKNFSLNSRKTGLGANNQISNIALSENLDYVTTKHELLEAQEREQILAEQDKKVEQTKDQRNTLESFVYDTRNKLQNAYRSFATDSEKEGILKSLQETEDWLYEDSDDESDEQNYTGKFDDLKKLIEPIANRYNEEKARTQATKALQSCINKYRSAANSLPPNQKDEVLNECSAAEQWLNSLSNKEPTLWIEEATKTVDRRCTRTMKSKPLIKKQEKPMDSNQIDVSLDSNPRDQSVDSNQRNQPGDSNQGGQPVDSNQRDQPMDSKQRDQPMDSNQKDQPVDSNQKDQSVDSNQRNQSVDSNQRNQHVDSNQRDQLIDSNQKDQPVDSNQKDQSVDSNQRNQHVDSNQKNQHVDSNQKNQHVDSNQGDQLTDSKQRDQPMDLNQKDQPVDPNQKGQLGESDKMDPPMDSDQGDQPEDMEHDQ